MRVMTVVQAMYMFVKSLRLEKENRVWEEKCTILPTCLHMRAK